MSTNKFEEIFNEEVLSALFASDRADQFFDALFGDASEGAYDIKLNFREFSPERQELLFDLELHERPGKCLACNLTYGLPEVFSRHPIINIKGLVQEIEKLLGGDFSCRDWQLQTTRQQSKSMHAIPLSISLK